MDIFWLYIYFCFVWCLFRFSVFFSFINFLLVFFKIDDVWGVGRGGIRGFEAMGWLGKWRDEFFFDCLMELVVDCLFFEFVFVEGEWWRWGLDFREGFRKDCLFFFIYCKMRWRLIGRKGMSLFLRLGRIF